MKFRNWFVIQEMPLNINLVGDWEGAKKRIAANDIEKTSAERYAKPKNLVTAPGETHPIGGINKWPSSTIGLLTNPVGRENIVKRFQNVPEDFVANMVITPLAHKRGVTDQKEISEKQLRQSLEVTPDEAPVYPNKINLFFVRNDGGDLMDLNAWIIAHRFGHMLDWEDYNSNSQSSIRAAYKNFEKMVFSILKDSYGLKIESYAEISYLFLVNSLLTMKSARTQRIRSDNDIAAELTSQYIFSRKIKFNKRLPDKVPNRTSSQWARKLEIGWVDRIGPAEVDLTDWETYIGQVIQLTLNEAKGKIYLM